MTGALTIAGIGVRRDAAGRYSLNDLHRAAGGANKHRPSLWVENQQTRQLAETLEREAEIPALVSVHGGAAAGTFAARELVYAYAMWISPEFHLAVIRAYDALATQPAPAEALAALQDPAALRALLLGYVERQLQLEQQVEAQTPKVEAFDRLASSRGMLCLTDAAKALKMRRTDLIQWMQEHGWIYRRAGSEWVPYQPRVHAGTLALKLVPVGQGDSARTVGQVLVTPKGMARLGELLARERATA